MTLEQEKKLEELKELSSFIKSDEKLKELLIRIIFIHLKASNTEINDEEIKKLISLAYAMLTILLQNKKIILLS